MLLKAIKSGNIDGKKAIFEQQCAGYGFKPDDYKREFSANGRDFQLIGFNRKAPKNNCIIYCIDDKKECKCNDEMVKRAFIAQENG